MTPGRTASSRCGTGTGWTGWSTSGGAVVGVRGTRLAPTGAARGEDAPRVPAGEFELRAPAVLVTSGGIGGDHDLVRAAWPERLGTAPAHLLSGVPAYVDGRMLAISRDAGASVVNADRMWHYTEGVTDHDPVWPRHGIRILPGPSSMWLDATGRRLPAPLFPGFDTLGTLAHIMTTGHAHTWFLLNQAIIAKEFALSGSEQNPDLTGKDLRGVLGRVRPGVSEPVAAFQERGVDFVSAPDLDGLLRAMDAVTDEPMLDHDLVRRQVQARDREMANPFSKDAQVTALRGARRYRGDRLVRVATPRPLTDPRDGPLVAVRLHVVTRKTLGGLETDLEGRVLRTDGTPLPGLWAAGEVSGFGGGGMHGYRSLEGTFLGGCLFSGRQAGRSVVAAVR